jgi:hypothetical protein
VNAVACAQSGFAGTLRLTAGECVTLRPIRPRDAGTLQAYIRNLSSESRYNRFFGALNELPSAELLRRLAVAKDKGSIATR